MVQEWDQKNYPQKRENNKKIGGQNEDIIQQPWWVCEHHLNLFPSNPPATCWYNFSDLHVLYWYQAFKIMSWEIIIIEFIFDSSPVHSPPVQASYYPDQSTNASSTITHVMMLLLQVVFVTIYRHNS